MVIESSSICRHLYDFGPPWNFRFKHKISILLPQLFKTFINQSGPSIQVIGQKTGNLDRIIQVFLHLTCSRNELLKTLHRHSIHRNGYDQAIRRRESLHNEKTQRGWAIYEAKVVSPLRADVSLNVAEVPKGVPLLNLLNSFPKEIWTRGLLPNLSLDVRKVTVGRNKVITQMRRFNDPGKRPV